MTDYEEIIGMVGDHLEGVVMNRIGVPKFIRRERTQRGLTQQQLAQLIGKDQARIGQIETKQETYLPTVAEVNALARVLDIHTATILWQAGFDIDPACPNSGDIEIPEPDNLKEEINELVLQTGGKIYTLLRENEQIPDVIRDYAVNRFRDTAKEMFAIAETFAEEKDTADEEKDTASSTRTTESPS